MGSVGGLTEYQGIPLIHSRPRALILYHTLGKAICNPIHQSISVGPVYDIVRSHNFVSHITPPTTMSPLTKLAVHWETHSKLDSFSIVTLKDGKFEPVIARSCNNHITSSLLADSGIRGD